MIETEEWEIVNEIAVALYAAKNRESMRRAFLSHLMRLIPFELADFSLTAPQEDEPYRLVDPVVVSRFEDHRTVGFTELYEMGYYKLDYVSWIFSHPKSMVYRESDLIDDKVRKESRFYRHYLARYDLGNVAGISIISGGKLRGAVTLYKSEQSGDFSGRDLYILKQLMPHLQNVLAEDSGSEEKERNESVRVLKYRYRITGKEMEVIALILQGCSNAEIASARGISQNTVKSQVADIFGKTGVKSRTQLFRFLIEEGLSAPFVRPRLKSGESAARNPRPRRDWG